MWLLPLTPPPAGGPASALALLLLRSSGTLALCVGDAAAVAAGLRARARGTQLPWRSALALPWQRCSAGERFSVPANSSFQIRVTEAFHYICHYA